MKKIQFRKEISRPKTVVVKIGSKILTAAKDPVHKRRLRTLTEDIAALKNDGIQVVVVSSGAISHGMNEVEGVVARHCVWDVEVSQCSTKTSTMQRLSAGKARPSELRVAAWLVSAEPAVIRSRWWPVAPPAG